MLFTPIIMTDAKSEAAASASAAADSHNPSGPDDAQHQQQLQAPADKSADNNSKSGTSTPAVRFSSAVQEFSLDNPEPVDTAEGQSDAAHEVTPEELKAFTKSLHGPLLQERRLNTYQFEAFSLPPSRVR